MKNSLFSIFVMVSLGFSSSLWADEQLQSNQNKPLQTNQNKQLQNKQNQTIKSRPQGAATFQQRPGSLANPNGAGAYKCSLHYGEWVCTGATEDLAHQACQVGVGSDKGGCNSNPDGTVSCTCGNNQ